MHYSKEDMQRIEHLRHQWRNQLLYSYKNKPDEELKAIINHNGRAIHSQDLVEASKSLAEMEACNILLKQRAEDRLAQASARLEEQQALEKAMVAWNNNISLRKMNAILNLPVATSYHGQLVAAVLSEEDGLTVNEICQWSAELSALKRVELDKVIKGLVNEGIIVIDQAERCWLLTICDKSLFPVDAVQWAKKKYQHERNRELHETQLNFVVALAANNGPLTEYDWLKISGALKELEQAKQTKYSSTSRITKLTFLVDAGILSVTPVQNSNCNLYYFPMLGEGKKYEM